MGSSGLAPVAFGLIGGSFGGPWGYVIGSMIGAALFPPEGTVIEGPRLRDLTVQSSAYGQPIPLIFGTMRVAGNVIWSTGLIETRHEEEDDGKGGPSQTTITYTYSASFAITIAQGPILGVRRIWADSKLIYNVGINAPLEQIMASNRNNKSIRIYTGTETQLPDPLITALTNANNPAYRGTSYAVMEVFQLADFANHIPNFTFETVGVGTVSHLVNDIFDVGAIGTDHVVHADNGSVDLFVSTIIFTNSGIMSIDRYSYQGVLIGTEDFLFGHPTDTFNEMDIPIRDAPADQGWYMGTRGASPTIACFWFYAPGEQPFLPTADFKPSTQLSSIPKGTTFSLGAGDGTQDSQLANFREAIYFDQRIYARKSTAGGGTGTRILIWNVFEGIDPDTGNPTFNPFSAAFADFTLRPNQINGTLGLAFSINANEDGLYGYLVDTTEPSAEIHKFTHDGVWVRAWDVESTIPGIADGLAVTLLVKDDLRAIIGKNDKEAHIIDLNADGSVTVVESIIGFTSDSANHLPTPISPNTVLVLERYISFDLITTASPTLETVVEDLTNRAGLTNAVDVDATALSGINVDGYLIARQGSARDALQPLVNAHLFDLVESDWTLTAVLRGGASVTSILEADMAAHVGGGGGRPETLVSTRSQERELPVKVEVTFVDPIKNYDNGIQYAEKLTTQSKEVAALQLPMSMTADFARQLAHKTLFNAWIERELHDISVGPKFIELEPADVITFIKGIRTFVARITEIDYQLPGVINIRCVDEDSDAYASILFGQVVEDPAQQINFPGLTIIKMLDTTLLRDVDDSAGFYTATGGILLAHRGAALYKSLNQGNTFFSVQTMPDATTIGQATDVLASGPTEIFDLGSTVNVRVTTVNSPSIVSVSEADLLSGSNRALIGKDGRWEVIGFQNATLEGNGTFTLDKFMRGLRGTEHNVGNHAVTDCFVLLTQSTMGRVLQDQDELDSIFLYKAVSLGNSLQETQSFRFTNTGEGLHPYSVVERAGVKETNNDITLTWTRRSRIGGEWRSQGEVPLAEQSEAYEIDIFNGATVVRTLTAITATVIYLEADQITDFGSEQATVKVDIFQMSAIVGRGNTVGTIVLP